MAAPFHKGCRATIGGLDPAQDGNYEKADGRPGARPLLSIPPRSHDTSMTAKSPAGLITGLAGLFVNNST
jgi:hypothetical protein